ncbi:hypothetical protein BST61_g3771 [Cercospora zeina]
MGSMPSNSPLRKIRLLKCFRETHRIADFTSMRPQLTLHQDCVPKMHSRIRPNLDKLAEEQEQEQQQALEIRPSSSSSSSRG